MENITSSKYYNIIVSQMYKNYHFCFIPIKWSFPVDSHRLESTGNESSYRKKRKNDKKYGLRLFC